MNGESIVDAVRHAEAASGQEKDLATTLGLRMVDQIVRAQNQKVHLATLMNVLVRKYSITYYSS